MKRFGYPIKRTRDGATFIQTHENEVGKDVLRGGTPPSAVAPGLFYMEHNHSIAVDGDQRITATLAAKAAVVGLLINMVGYDTELKPLMLGQRQPGPRIEVGARSISIDWPEGGVDLAPVKFTVRDADDWKFDGLGLSGADMDEDTVDVFGEGTVLLHRHDVTGTVIIETALSTQSARNALQLALTDRFGVEPRDFRAGRRVVLSCYYDRMVRITLADQPFSFAPDPTGEKAKQNDYPLLCFLNVEIPDVILIRAPGRFETPARAKMP